MPQRDLVMERHFARLYERIQVAILADDVQQALIERPAGQQTVQTGLFPAPKIIRRDSPSRIAESILS